MLASFYSAEASTIIVTSKIQTAIDGANDGDVIKIPAGTYNELITIDGFKKLTITGAGQGVTIIDGNGLTGDVVTISNSEKITFHDCTVTSSATFYNNFILSYIKDVTITKCTIESAAEAGIVCMYATRLKVKDCLFQNNGNNGLSINNSFKSSITSSIFDLNGSGIWIYSCHKTIVAKNKVTNNSFVGIANDISHNSIILKNTITGNIFDGLYHNGTGTFGNVYSKNVISGNLGSGVNLYGGSPMLSNNFIDNNGGMGISNQWYSNTTFTKNTISNNGIYGIYMYNSSGYLFKNNITQNSNTGIQYTLGNDPLTSRILALISNKITSNGGFGLYSGDSTNLSILDAKKNFIVSSSTNNGIYFQSGQCAFFDKNTIAANSGIGIAVNSPALATMTKNFLYSNTSDGIITGDNSVIYKNRAYLNGDSGIAGFSTSHLENNIVLGNFQHGIDGTGGANSLIENNKVLGNGDGLTWFDLYDPSTDDVWINNKYDTSSL